MNLSDFSNKSLSENLLSNKIISNFINELKEVFEKKNLSNNKYSDYWSSQKFIEDNVSCKIGISRYGANIIYSDEISKKINNSVLQISEKEGTLYRKKFPANSSSKGQFYNVEKFENGEITKVKIPKRMISKEFQDKDIIFKINQNGKIEIKEDIREKVVNLASKELVNLKQKEISKNNEYKKEGHIYEAFEDDGYIFLNDITEKRDFCIEDIDFIVNNYQGEGKYQVIDGEYQFMSKIQKDF